MGPLTRRRTQQSATQPESSSTPNSRRTGKRARTSLSVAERTRSQSSRGRVDNEDELEVGENRETPQIDLPTDRAVSPPGASNDFTLENFSNEPEYVPPGYRLPEILPELRPEHLVGLETGETESDSEMRPHIHSDHQSLYQMELHSPMTPNEIQGSQSEAQSDMKRVYHLENETQNQILSESEKIYAVPPNNFSKMHSPISSELSQVYTIPPPLPPQHSVQAEFKNHISDEVYPENLPESYQENKQRKPLIRRELFQEFNQLGSDDFVGMSDVLTEHQQNICNKTDHRTKLQVTSVSDNHFGTRPESPVKPNSEAFLESHSKKHAQVKMENQLEKIPESKTGSQSTTESETFHQDFCEHHYSKPQGNNDQTEGCKVEMVATYQLQQSHKSSGNQFYKSIGHASQNYHSSPMSKKPTDKTVMVFDNRKRSDLSSPLYLSPKVQPILSRQITPRNKPQNRSPSTSVNSKDIFEEVFDACLKTNISLIKLQSAEVRQFFEKHFDKEMPDLASMRTNYLEPSFNAKREKLRQILKNQCLYLVIKDHVDSSLGYIVSLLIGNLNSQPANPYLYRLCFFQDLNVTILSQELMSILHSLWPDGLQFDRLRLLVTEDNRLMADTAKFLKTIFPYLKHAHCLRKVLDNLCNNLRSIFPLVDEFHLLINRLMAYSPKFAFSFEYQSSKTLTIPLPLPLPLGQISNGVEWLRTVIAYIDNKPILKRLLFEFEDSGHKELVKKAKKLVDEKDLQYDFLNVLGFRCILDAVVQISKPSLTLAEQKNAVESLGLESKRQTLSLMAIKALKESPDYFLLPSERDTENSDQETSQDQIIEDKKIYTYAPLTTNEATRVLNLLTKLKKEYDYPEIQPKDLAMLVFMIYNSTL